MKDYLVVVQVEVERTVRVNAPNTTEAMKIAKARVMRDDHAAVVGQTEAYEIPPKEGT